MSTEAGFDVVIGSDGARTGGQQVNQILNGMRQSFVELSAKIFVFQRSMDSMWRAVNEGARATETMQRLDRQMQSLGSNAGTMIRAMERATQSQLGMASAAQLASRALAIGLSPDQIAVFAGAAENLSDVMGTDIPQAFESLVSASATGSNRALAQMGIFIDLEGEMLKLAVSTGRTTEQISKQEKAMLSAKLIAEEMKSGTDGLGDAMLSQADKLDQAAKFWTDFFTSIKQQLADLTVKAMEFAKPLIEPFKAIIEGGNTFPLTGSADGPLPKNGLKAGDGVDSLPFSLRSAQIKGDQERALAANAAILQREQAAAQTMMQLQDTLVQRRIQTEEQALIKKEEFQARALVKTKEALNLELASARETYQATLKLAGITTEEKIQLEIQYKDKVAEVNEKIKTTDQELKSLRILTASQVEVARLQAEERVRANIESNAANMFQMEERHRQRALDGWELYYKGQIDLANAAFANDQEIARNEQALLREQLAFKLRLTREEIDELLRLRSQGNVAGVGTILGRADPLLGDRAKQGILSSGAAQDTLLAERASGDFFSGWARGMQGYIRDTSTGFGMARDMARRTAQTMEQGFQQFFFDPMENGWKGMLSNLENMTKQVISQMAAQMVTSGLMQMLTSVLGAVGGGFFSGNSFGSAFALATHGPVSLPGRASGGVDNWGKGTPVMLHGYEATVPLPGGRSIPVDLNLGGSRTLAGGGMSMPVTIINQHNGAEVETRQRDNSNTGTPELEIMITKAVNRAVQEGRMDKTMRSRFGLNPGER